jgi:hypothetical protein
MGSTFEDLDEFFSPGLTLTVRGQEYTLPLPSAGLGLWCRRIAAVAGEVTAASTDAEMSAATARANERAQELPHPPGSDDDLSFEELILGDTYAAMVADEVPDPYVQFCAQTGYVWIIAGEDAAGQFWRAGGRPEVREPENRAGRRAAKKATPKTSTAAARVTRPPVSTSGTSSRRK